jgi:hypothetical protein
MTITLKVRMISFESFIVIIALDDPLLELAEVVYVEFEEDVLLVPDVD